MHSLLDNEDMTGNIEIDRDAQLWRYNMETMKLENRLLLRTGKEWELQNYKWTLPDDGESGEVKGTVVKFEKKNQNSKTKSSNFR